VLNLPGRRAMVRPVPERQPVFVNRPARRPKDAGPAPLARLTAPQAATMRRAAWISALGALAWLPQAWVLALTMGDALVGRFDRAPVLIGVFVALGIGRAGMAALAEGQLFRAAEALVATARARLIAREARRGPDAVAGPGAVAALAAEKLDLLVPYVTRYAPARARAMLLPAAILGAALAGSWAVAIVFLISGPLIPVFQALIGIAAKEASKRQLAEVGSLNDLLVDRLSALTAVRLFDAEFTSTEAYFRDVLRFSDADLVDLHARLII